jgi:pSer/pThr/pTyr-binding forkhead associated (FHA) protein
MNLTVSFFIGGHLRETRQVETPCTIGRSSQSIWVVEHPMLSRHHCILFEREEDLYLCDEGSLNGTVVKGIPVQGPVRLQFGDEFTVGKDLKFRVSAPMNEQPMTEKMDLTEQSTAVLVKKKSTSQQSTIIFKESSSHE